MNGNLELAAEPGHCQCGCGSLVNGRKQFLQGHDAKLKSQLIEAHVQGYLVEVRTGGMLDTFTALDYANHYGFGHQVEASARSRIAKETAKIEKQNAKLAAKTAGRVKADAAKVQALVDTPRNVAIGEKAIDILVESISDGTPCRAKVGRWEYDGRISSDSKTFTFTTPKGEAKTSTRFTLI